MDDFQTTSKLNLIQHHQSSSSTIKKNQILIRVFFCLIILLALFTGAIIINLVYKYNISQQKLRTDQHRELVRVFCYMTRHPDSCLPAVSMYATPYIQTSPDDVFNASLQVAIKELHSLTSLSRALILKSGEEVDTESIRNGSALFSCSSLIDDSLNQLNKSLTVSAGFSVFGTGLNPDEETAVQDKIKGMKPWINDAWRDLWSCFGILEKEQSTAGIELRNGMQNPIMYVGNIIDFLENRDRILGEIRFQELMADHCDGFEYLSTLVLYAPQYFVLIFLLCLFFRMY
ncbi:OLC1v1012623C1 [Oldenlandia corymbosa var. corymbosa]|uniref:OLC1v1012623C1 n=1 Tax=Oldenlandia corymbosa var. corymbosa TaxID=529605 RepID=A0AAV1DWA8_OLDCO|nr:OLC1v1012623C1 [Oldenlandia corymbosa var. corymbosa]